MLDISHSIIDIFCPPPLASVSAGESSFPTDPLAMMEYYAKKASEEERKRRPKQSHDEMPPPASLQGVYM